MKLLASAVRRNTFENDSAGGFVCVDLNTKQYIHKNLQVKPAPFCNRNPNPRGGARGFKGIIRYNDQYVINNNDALIFFNQDFSLNKILTHTAFCALHHLTKDDNYIYATSTSSEIYAKFDKDLNCKIFSPMDSQEVLDIIHPYRELRGRPIRQYDPTQDYREEYKEATLHMNYVQPLKDGSVVALLSSMNMLIQLEPEPKILWAPPLKEKLIVDMPLGYPGLNAPHDIVQVDHKLYINSSRSQKLMTYDLKTGDLEEIAQFENKYEWTRGLVYHQDYLYIGTGIGQVLKFHLPSRKLESAIQVFPEDENPYSIFGILIEDE